MGTVNTPESESAWTAKLCNDMAKLGAMVRAITGSRLQSSGMPDRWLVYRSGQYVAQFWLEFKLENGRLRTNQKLTIREMEQRGVCVFVVRYPDKIEDSNGATLSTFDGTGRGLLVSLLRLCGLTVAAASLQSYASMPAVLPGERRISYGDDMRKPQPPSAE